jgi:molecular chaperone DnaJ
MPDGDLQIEFRVHRHQIFERQALELRMPLKISVFDLIAGTTVKVPTIEGDQVEVVIPPRTQPGTIMRLQGRGLIANGIRGSQFLLITAVIPDTISDSLLEQILLERSKIK